MTQSTLTTAMVANDIIIMFNVVLALVMPP